MACHNNGNSAALHRAGDRHVDTTAAHVACKIVTVERKNSTYLLSRICRGEPRLDSPPTGNGGWRPSQCKKDNYNGAGLH